MSESQVDDLLRRIERLEAANRRWKVLAAVALFAAGLLLWAATAFSVAAHTAARRALEATEQERIARQELAVERARAARQEQAEQRQKANQKQP